jgi:division protein CdvB (Snf7/Vps24/ESCRT-III family)
VLHQSTTRVSEGVLDTQSQQCRSSRKVVKLISEAKKSMNELAIREISRVMKRGALVMN